MQDSASILLWVCKETIFLFQDVATWMAHSTSPPNSRRGRNSLIWPFFSGPMFFVSSKNSRWLCCLMIPMGTRRSPSNMIKHWGFCFFSLGESLNFTSCCFFVVRNRWQLHQGFRKKCWTPKKPWVSICFNAKMDQWFGWKLGFTSDFWSTSFPALGNAESNTGTATRAFGRTLGKPQESAMLFCWSPVHEISHSTLW